MWSTVICLKPIFQMRKSFLKIGVLVFDLIFKINIPIFIDFCFNKIITQKLLVRLLKTLAHLKDIFQPSAGAP